MIWRLYPVGPRPPECACSCGLDLPLDDDWDREGKRGALARLRLDPDLAPVHLDDALRYGGSEIDDLQRPALYEHASSKCSPFSYDKSLMVEESLLKADGIGRGGGRRAYR